MSYIYSYFYPKNVKLEQEKLEYQKYLICQQIVKSKLKLKHVKNIV